MNEAEMNIVHVGNEYMYSLLIYWILLIFYHGVTNHQKLGGFTTHLLPRGRLSWGRVLSTWELCSRSPRDTLMLFGHRGCCLSQEIPYGPLHAPLMAPPCTPHGLSMRPSRPLHAPLMAPPCAPHDPSMCPSRPLHAALTWLFPACIISQ